MKIYGERAPLDRVIKRAELLCNKKHGGEILKLVPSLERRVSRNRGNVYFVRCWHVQYRYPITNSVGWQRMDWEEQRGKWKLFCCNWNTKPPHAFEVIPDLHQHLSEVGR